MNLTLGFSPCPNDTFIFDALVNGKIDTKGLHFDYVLEDVETLNRWATEGKLDITKLSYSAFLLEAEQYALLHSGSALGKGVGPLLVTSPGKARSLPGQLTSNESSVAIPGKLTTANLLFSLAYPQCRNKTEMLFSDIEEAVRSGTVDAGLLIHENRFTYEQRGLVKIADLGDWWEQTTGAAIPLGGIVIRRGIDHAIAATVDSLIRESLLHAWAGYPDLAPFVTANAQEMDEDVMRKHINLYVNNFTEELGAEGERAISTLFAQAERAGLIKTMPESVFY